MRAWRLLSSFVAFSLLAVPMASAQGTTGGVTGTVSNDQGTVAGVKVSISSPSLIGGSRDTQTGTDGRYFFTQLAPGYYDIGLPDFKTQEMKRVEVSVDRAVEGPLKLVEPLTPDVPAFFEAITVSAVDVTRTGISTVFSTEYLDHTAISSQGRSYQLAIGRTPGADGTAVDPRVFGSTISENAYYIDGIDVNDPLTGTFGINFNFDAIAGISIQTAGFTADAGRATGAVVNLVTKSGGDQFSGPSTPATTTINSMRTEITSIATQTKLSS